MRVVVSSASGKNGDGHGALLSFDENGRFFGAMSSDARIQDPRGLRVHPDGTLLFVNSGANRVLALDRDGRVVRDSGHIADLNPGGGNFGPDGRFHAGARSMGTILAFASTLDQPPEPVLPVSSAAFPRGFALDDVGGLYFALGAGLSGDGPSTILAFSAERTRRESFKVVDAELSALDLALAPNGNVVVSSEWPFGASDSTTTIREYSPEDGRLVRVLLPGGKAEFRKPRGLRFGADGNLYCVSRDEIVAFDFVTGECLGPFAQFSRLNGQALEFFG
jgi:hypothetical protein